MVSKISTISFQGLKATRVSVQVQIVNGLPAFSIVGLPDKAVAESRERIRSALYSVGLSLPAKRITVNLSPADLQKEGSHYDFPITLSLLHAMDILPSTDFTSHICLGELELDGTVRSVHGILPAALETLNAGSFLICPYDNAAEAAWVEGLNIIACPSLLSYMNHLKGTQILMPPPPRLAPLKHRHLDYQDIKGHPSAKRVMEIAAVGRHNVLLIGPPGTGKSMMAARLPTILPPLNPQEALEISCIYSMAGLLTQGALLQERPFRSPHHSASLAAMVGGGSRALPGEISLAHNGVLFLDELPEFSRATLESLRQPLEEGTTLIARARAHVSYPANFQLIAAMNPCKCGYLGTPHAACHVPTHCHQAYRKKLSGPLLDRIDMHLEMAPLDPLQLIAKNKEEESATIRKRVIQATAFKTKREQNDASPLAKNPKDYNTWLCAQAQQLLYKAAEKFSLSARSYTRIIQVARSIADLEESSSVERAHIAEALSYRGNMEEGRSHGHLKQDPRSQHHHQSDEKSNENRRL